MGKTYQPAGAVEFRGRNVTLFRRSSRPNSPLSFRVQVRGSRQWVTTDTADLADSKARALELLAEIHSAPPDRPRPSGIPTVATIIEAFSAGDVHVREGTAAGYSRCLRIFVRQATGRPAMPQRIDALSEKLVRDWQAIRQGRDHVNYVQPLKANTSANSILRQARALFGRRPLKSYAEAGWTIPDSLEGFLRARNLKEVSHAYQPIPAETIDAMNEAMPDLKQQDERLWAMLLMIRLMGLRRSEVVRARTGWIVEGAAGAVLAIHRREGEEAPKRQDGDIPIPPVLREWFAAKSNGHLIPGRSDNERAELADRLSGWVREFIPDREKSLHELRKHAGSRVAEKTSSIEQAARFLRIDPKTARAHYVSILTPQQPLDLEDL